MRAFGWKAAHLEVAETPVGAACLGCECPIAAGDEGVTMPGTDEEGRVVLEELGIAGARRRGVGCPGAAALNAGRHASTKTCPSCGDPMPKSYELCRGCYENPERMAASAEDAARRADRKVVNNVLRKPADNVFRRAVLSVMLRDTVAVPDPVPVFTRDLDGPAARPVVEHVRRAVCNKGRRGGSST